MAATIWLGLRQHAVVVNKRYHPARAEEAAGGGDRFSPQRRHRAEYRWLQAASDHPVVEVVEVDEGQLTTVTGFAGSATALSTGRPPAEAARLLGAVACAVGVLHRHALVHGNLAGDHIVVNGPRFVLCSPSGLVDDPTADVVSLGAIIAVLCGRWRASGSAHPDAIDALAEIATNALEPAMSADRLGARLLGFAGRSGRVRRFRLARPGRPSRGGSLPAVA